jgi:peptidoglycan hydrolase-like protein with peptidoglycan-binding domain
MAGQTHHPSAKELAAGLALSTDVRHRVVVPFDMSVRLVSVTPQFAPGGQIYEDGDIGKAKPGEVCQIKYDVNDFAGRIKEARLEIARKADAGNPIVLVDLEPSQFSHGSHTFDWDGRCTEGEMADNFVHALHSPYLVRIVAKGKSKEVEDKGLEIAVQLAGLRLVRGRDTPLESPPDEGSDAYYQSRLLYLGFHPGPIDGSIGAKSKRAIKAFQRCHAGLRATGNLDAYTKAYLDEKAPEGSDDAHYQFILNYVGYHCGAIDGLVAKKTKRAIAKYRQDHGLAAGEDLDDDVKTALDAEALAPLDRRVILEKDLDFPEPHGNPLPEAGAEKKIYVDADGSISPLALPYRKKFSNESQNLLRPHFPIVARPLVRTSEGKLAFAPAAVGPMRIDFTVDTAAPPADLGVPDPTARAFVQKALAKDGGQATTGYHAHKNCGGVRTDADPGVFLDKQALKPFDVAIDGQKYKCTCIEDADDSALGTAGVYFAPSTIGGDRFSLVGTVNAEGFDTPPAKDIKTQTGTMIVWRRYRIGKRWFMEYVPKAGHRIAGDQLGLAPWYTPAFIEFINPVANPSPLMIQPRAADPEVVDLALYTAIIREAGYRTAQLSDEHIKQRFEDNILWPLRPAAVYNPADEQGYHDAVHDEIQAFEERFSRSARELSLLEMNEGHVVVAFDDNAPPAGTRGIHAVTNPDLQSWGWSALRWEGVVLLVYDQDTEPTAVANGARDGETLAHEVGHSLWLHHASTKAGTDPDASNQPEHNKAEWQTCTMSYISLANFCGLCVLKLRGWDEAKL